MGKNTYSQVRIAIDGTHYIKGMAIIKHDMDPNGPDIIFNTPKKRGTPILGDENNTVLKLLKRDKDGNVDQDNPFGSSISRQIIGIDPKTGKEKTTSALNMVNEEGDWEDWRKSMPSQVLAKQPHSFINSQLKLTRQQVTDDLAEINKITNPIVRKDALEKYATQIDADAVDLRAAAMPRQRTQVLIAVPNLKKDEVYAPQFETGEKLVLIRYPHGGPFEIPEVTVNNNSRTAKKLLGNAKDAIGIHPDVAQKLLGADFDGDSVVAIPNRSGLIKGSSSLGNKALVYDKALKNFEPKRIYGGYEVKTPAVGKKGEPGYKPEVGNFKLMTQTGMEMGMITNLITDMSIQGATPEHMVLAVKHAQVVIDAEKHKLDYKQSEIDNSIRHLKMLYQGKSTSGATTLLSRATAKEYVPERKLRLHGDGGPINPKTGALEYVPTGKKNSKFDRKTGTYDETNQVDKMEKVKRLALTDDAYTLVKDPKNVTPVEKLYADHANAMKALANAARLQSSRIPNPPTNPVAKKTYASEVDKLKADVVEAEKQLPIERKANSIAKGVVLAKRAEDPTLKYDSDRLQKVERQAKAGARARLNIERPVIEISDRQWDAIQAGAVSPTRLRKVLKYADPKRVQELSMPRTNTVMSSAVSSRAKTMLAAGVAPGDVAAALGISVSTLNSAVKRGDV